MVTRSEGRVAVAGTILALLQSVGFIISLYFLVSSYTNQDRDDPTQHVCVEALLCLMFRSFLYLSSIMYRVKLRQCHRA